MNYSERSSHCIGGTNVKVKVQMSLCLTKYTIWSCILRFTKHHTIKCRLEWRYSSTNF